MAGQTRILTWIADHRRHHGFTDKPLDPHTPDRAGGRVGGRFSGRSRFSGLYYAEIGWLFDPQVSIINRFARDWLGDPIVTTVNRFHWEIVYFSLATPTLVGFLFTHTWQGALSRFLLGGPVRMFALHRITGGVNALCHRFGRRPYDTGDSSTNLGWFALLSFGESFHNNHHAYPECAIVSHEPGQVDVGGMFIVLLEKLGMVWHVKRVPAHSEAARSVG